MSNEAIAKLDQILAIVKDIKASMPAKPAPTDILPFEKLNNDWADKTVKKLPKNWKGKAVVSVTKYSELTAEDADQLAGFYNWKAEHPQIDEATGEPAKNNQGKPWFEGDLFESKILRTWAAYARSGQKRTRVAHAPQAPAPGAEADSSDSDEIPF